MNRKIAVSTYEPGKRMLARLFSKMARSRFSTAALQRPAVCPPAGVRPADKHIWLRGRSTGEAATMRASVVIEKTAIVVYDGRVILATTTPRIISAASVMNGYSPDHSL
eukprot:1194750-Prorocentrum_minimum.AAC.4